MAKSNGLGQRLYAGGVNVSGDIGMSDNCASPLTTLAVTAIDKSAMERIPGLKDGALDFTAYFNPASGASHDTFAALPTADVGLLYCTGTAIGDPAAAMVAKQIGYDGKRGTDGSLTFAITSQANGYGLEWGRLHTAATRTDTTATNGASYDGVAETVHGLQHYVQLVAFTGTSVTIKVQGSSDNGGADAFADITGATTGALTAVGAVRAATAAGVTVERYLRIVTTGTFSNAQFVAAVVRNPVAVAF